MSGAEAREFIANQPQEIKAREDESRVGFLMLTIGSALQLVGTLIAGFLN